MFLFNRNKGYEDINHQDYSAYYIDTATEHILIDVRTASEYAGGHLPNAINIPLNEIETKLNSIPQDKDIVVVCASGNRSKQGANKLIDADFKKVSNLKGGTMAWMMSGKPVER
jgi:rhodanese-related sulfurtransferase